MTELEKEILDFIGNWECDMGESWMDYIGNDYIFLNVHFLMGVWSVKFPELYYYLMKESNNTIPWKYVQDNLLDLIEELYIDHSNYKDEDYEKSLYPFVYVIANNNVYFDRFIKNHEENKGSDNDTSREDYYDHLDKIKALKYNK